MRARVLAAVVAALAAHSSIAAEPAKPPGRLGLDTPVVDLILDARTAKVIERRMPDFVDRMRRDAEFVDMIASSSLNDLSRDPHVRGLTPEVLARLRTELEAAQAEGAPAP